MSKMEKPVLVCEFQEITSQNSGTRDGKDWQVINFRATYMDGEYENDVVFTTFYKPLIERVEKLLPGEQVEIEYLPGGSYNKAKDMWFPNITAFKVYPLNDQSDEL